VAIPAGSRDLERIAEGRLLVSHGNGAAEYDLADGKRLPWAVEAYKDIQTARRLPGGNTLLCTVSGTLYEVDPAGKEVGKTQIAVETLNMRLMRVLSGGNLLIGAANPRAAIEVARDGKVVKTLPLPDKSYTAIRLPDGATMAGTGGDVRIVTLDTGGKIVSHVGGKGDHPDLGLDFCSGWDRLENGNCVMANWLGHGKQGTAPHLVEFTPDNKVVWTWEDHKAARQVTNVLMLDAARPSQCGEWPQWRGPNRDGVWAETGIVDAFDAPDIRIKWRAPISAGYSSPTVAAGRVYVTDRVAEPNEIERVHCFDWQTGKPIWSHSYDCHYDGFGYRAGPRAAVLVDGGRAYSLGAAGRLFSFDAADGRVLWDRDLRAEYAVRMPNWGIAAAPLVEGDLLVVHIGGAGDACLCAFDKTSGQPRWTALPDDASYSAPIVIDQAGQRVLVCLTADRIVGLDPQSGRLYWEYPFPWQKWPIGIATPVVHGDLLLISDAHNGSLLLRLSKEKPAVEKVWHRRHGDGSDGAALHCLISTPSIEGSHIFGVDGRGVLRCLRLDTGEQLWEDRTAVPEDRFATIHLVRNGQRTWMFNECGELIIARLAADGFHQISRAKLIEPTMEQLRRGNGVTWSHPAFAYRHVFARNDKELVCADLSAK
jgi:outer membrane protein assembly factor BamB